FQSCWNCEASLVEVLSLLNEPGLERTGWTRWTWWTYGCRRPCDLLVYNVHIVHYVHTQSSVHLMAPSLAATFAHRFMILRLAVSTAAWLLSAAMDCIHRGPGAAFGLILRHTLIFIAFLDVPGLTFLFICVFVFVAPWHFTSSLFVPCVYDSASCGLSARRYSLIGNGLRSAIRMPTRFGVRLAKPRPYWRQGRMITD